MRKLILLVFLGTVSAHFGYSQNRLSLSDALAIALKNSYNIQLAKNNVEIANRVGYFLCGVIELFGIYAYPAGERFVGG